MIRSFAKLLLAAIAVLLGIICVPSIYGWLILSWMGTISVMRALEGTSSLSLNELTLAVPYATGWWGWCAIGWMAYRFRHLGASTPPRWVLAGLLSGISTILTLAFFIFIDEPLNSVIPRSYSDWSSIFMFGGAPILFALAAMIRYRLGCCELKQSIKTSMCEHPTC